MTPEQVRQQVEQTHEEGLEKMHKGWTPAEIAEFFAEEAAILSRDLGVYYCARCGVYMSAPNFWVTPGGRDVYCSQIHADG